MGFNDHQSDPDDYAERFPHLAPPRSRFPITYGDTDGDNDTADTNAREVPKAVTLRLLGAGEPETFIEGVNVGKIFL